MLNRARMSEQIIQWVNYWGTHGTHVATSAISRVRLVAALLNIEESAWGEYRGARDDQTPRKLTQGEMARLLRPFGIRPRSIWPMMKRRNGMSSRKGYYRCHFETAWKQYCPTDGTTAQSSNVSFIAGR
jgi:hypothetical protein